MDSKDLRVFDFESEAIRCGWLADGEPYLIAADVCKVAGHTHVTNALARLDDDQKGCISITTPGGPQDMLYVTESGFYA